jgi:hypothetical protein
MLTTKNEQLVFGATKNEQEAANSENELGTTNNGQRTTNNEL